MLDLDGVTSDGFYEVVVTCTALGTQVLLGELGKTERNGFGIEELVSTLVALCARLAAGERGKNVIVVHRSNLVRIPVPTTRAVGAGDLINAHQTFEADGGEEERIVRLALNFVRTDASFERREVEGSVDERELVVHT